MVSLTSGCDTRGAQEIPSDEPGTRRFESPRSLAPFRDVRSYTFEGGCATYELSSPGAASSVVFAADDALAFVPRANLVRSVASREDLTLCGAGAACSG